MAICVSAVNRNYKCKTISWEKLLTPAIFCLEYRDTDKRIGLFCLEYRDTDKRIGLKGKRQKAA